MTPFDPSVAIKQVKAAYRSMLQHPVASEDTMKGLNMQRGLDGQYHPRIIALGGDHTIVGRTTRLQLTARFYPSLTLFTKSTDLSPLFISTPTSTHGTLIGILVGFRFKLESIMEHSSGMLTSKALSVQMRPSMLEFGPDSL